MATMSFFLSLSHSQIAVFDGRLEQPFNMWTEKHVNQGFSWRPGAVSFRTIASGGRHHVGLLITPEEVELPSDAVRIIQVPFEVPSHGSVEVASIPDARPFELRPGSYALRYECFPLDGGSEPRVNFVFMKRDNPTFSVLRADAELSLSGELLLTASPA
jgi:hypothetical protein